MSNEIKNLRFSPLLVVLVTTTTVFNLAKSAKGEIVTPALPISAATKPKAQKPPNLDGITNEPFPTLETLPLPDKLAVESKPAVTTSPETNPISQEKLPETNPTSQEKPPKTNPTSQEKPPETSPTSQEKPPETSQPTPPGETLPNATPATPTPEQPPSFNTPSPTFGQPVAPTQTTESEEPRVLVVEVLVNGATGELENLVYNTIRTKPGRAATRSQLQEDVNAIYATGYFGNVKVIPADTPLGVRVTFDVKPNPILKQISIETIPAKEQQRVLPPEVIQEIFGEQYNSILNLRDLQSGIKKLNEWYAKNGYDLAQVVGAPKISDEGTVTLVVAEGVVENIQVRFFNKEDEPANGRTRDFIVTREMRLKPGDVFNRNTAQKDLQRVFGLGLFEDVKLSFSPGGDPSEVIVNVDIVEGNTGSLAAGAGISSTSGLFGTVSYQEQNLGGNAQTLGVEAQVGQREILFDLNFTDPWIAGDPYRTSYSLNAFSRRTISLVYDGENSTIRTAYYPSGCDTTPGANCTAGFDSPRVVRTGGGITFQRPIAEDVFSKPDWRLALGFSYQHVQIENGNGDIAPFSAPLNGFPSEPLAFSPTGVDDLFTVNFSASQDFRNNPLQPTNGSFFRLGVEQSFPVGSGSILMSRIRGNYSYYIPLDFINSFEFAKGAEALAFNFQAGTVFGDLPPYEAFVLGGSNSVRSYGEGDLGSGRSYFQATAEYRFPVFSAIGGAIFLDYGSTLGSQGQVPGVPALVRGLPGSGYAYGLGVRIQSPVGPIRIDYGFGGNGQSKIQFGIGERF